MKITADRKKRLVSLFLSILLTAGLFASCGGETEAPTTEQTSTSTEEAPDAETDYLETLPTATYNGETFTLIGEDTAQRPNFDIGESNGDAFNDILFNRRITVENQYDIVIEQKKPLFLRSDGGARVLLRTLGQGGQPRAAHPA